MKQLLRLSFLLLFTINFTNILYSQNWKKENINPHADSLLAVYSWSAGNQYHTAWGKLFLFKNKRYKYSSFYPFANEEYSEGNYKFRKDTLILNSDFQANNLPIRIEYSDTDIQDRPLSFLRNLDGVLLRQARYFLNNDTSIAGSYYADFPLTTYPKDFLTNIKTLKVEVSPGITSQWMPIEKNKRFIIVTVLSRKDFNEYHPKVLTNYKFLELENKLIDLTGRL